MDLKHYLRGQQIASKIFESVSSQSTAWLKQRLYDFKYGNTSQRETYYLSSDKSDVSPEIGDNLLSEFQLDNGPIYQGLHFSHNSAYEEFLSLSNNGTEISAITSSEWFKAEQQTLRSASGIGKMFHYETIEKDKNKDFMAGHSGVVIKIDDPKTAIDIDKVDRGISFGRECVILLPGTYKISIVETHLPFVKSINAQNYKTEFMSIKSLRKDESDEKIRTKFEHVLFNYSNFDHEMKSHLTDLLLDSLKDAKYVVEVQHRSYDDENVIDIHWNIVPAFFYYVDILDDEQLEIVDNEIHEILRKIDREFRSKTINVDWTSKFDLRLGRSLEYAVKLSHFENNVKFINHVKRRIGLAYNVLNSHEETTRINNIKDPREKGRAIREIGNKIAQALSQMSKVSK